MPAQHNCGSGWRSWAACLAVGDVGFINFDALTSYMGKVDNASTTDIRSAAAT